MKRGEPTRIFRCTVALAALLLVGCSNPDPDGPKALPEGFLAFRNHDTDVAFVGQGACIACHYEIHATYQHTGMGRAFYAMGPDVVVEDFTDDNTVVVPETGLSYRMVERDGNYYQQQMMLDSSGRELALDEHRLVWVVGSNNHSRSYIIERGDKLFQAPVCWYPQEQIWELCPGYEINNDHFGRKTSSSCLRCHNGWMVPVEGEQNVFEEPYPLGIGCERCHGPGELHVETWSSGQAVATGGLDDTIVNPRRLPPQQRIHICFQCHLGDARASERVIRPGADFASMRPGQPMTDVVVPMTYVQETTAFGISSQADRLLLSRCYQESGGEIDCLTCHNPHVTVYDEDRPEGLFRDACLGCHGLPDCGETAAARQSTVGLADDCVACHMRRAEPDDQRFAEFTDHWIRRDIHEPERVRRRFDMRPVFPGHFASLSPGEQAFYDARALWLLARDQPERYRDAMWRDAAHGFRRAIADGYDIAETRYWLARSLRELGQFNESLEQLHGALRIDPGHRDAKYAVGQALLTRGKTEQALDIFRELLERDPDHSMPLAEAARAEASLGRPEAGLALIELAIEAEPWQSTLHVNRARLLAQLGRFEESADAAADAVRLNPDDATAWKVYEKTHEAAGRSTSAQEAGLIFSRLSSVD